MSSSSSAAAAAGGSHRRLTDTSPPQPEDIAKGATWSQPTLVAAYREEAEPITFGLAQAALRLSGVTASSPASPSSARILDLCAGSGVLSFAALPFVAHATCTDFAEGMVEAVSDRARRLGVLDTRLTAEVRDCCDLSAYSDSSFDVVFCLLGLFMVPWEEKRQQAVRDMYRVVKPGGCVIVANWSGWDRSPFHKLMFGCVQRAMQAKKAHTAANGATDTHTAPAAAAEESTASTPPAAAAAGTGNSKPGSPPTHPLATEDEHRALFAVAPFSSVSVASLSLASRTYLTPTDYWLGVKSFIPLWDWGTAESERRGDEAAVAWLSDVIGSQGSMNPHLTAIVAVGRK